MTITCAGYKRSKMHDDDVAVYKRLKMHDDDEAGFKRLKMHDDDVNRLQAFKDAFSLRESMRWPQLLVRKSVLDKGSIERLLPLMTVTFNHLDVRASTLRG